MTLQKEQAKGAKLLQVAWKLLRNNVLWAQNKCEYSHDLLKQTQYS